MEIFLQILKHFGLGLLTVIKLCDMGICVWNLKMGQVIACGKHSFCFFPGLLWSHFWKINFDSTHLNVLLFHSKIGTKMAHGNLRRNV